MTEESKDVEHETQESASSPGGEGATSEFEALAAERDRYRDLALRTRAEFENYQKRAARDLQTERQFAVQPLAVDLLPVIDNLDRALAAARPEGEVSGIFAGVELVRKQLIDAFAKHGIEPVHPDKVPFDPNVHQAVIQQPTADFPPMTVIHCLQTGYKMRDRVIRPAQVMVSAAPTSEE